MPRSAKSPPFEQGSGPDPTYATSELCARFHCDRKTLRRRARDLRLEVMKPGRERVYTATQVKALERLFRARSATPSEPASVPEATPAPRDAADALRAARARQTKRRFGPLRLTPREPDAVVVSIELQKR